MKKTLPDRKTLLNNVEVIYETILAEGEITWAGDILTTKRQLRARLRPIVGKITMQDYENLLIEKIILRLKLSVAETMLEIEETGIETPEQTSILDTASDAIYQITGEVY